MEGDNRNTASLQSVVDEAIVMFEQGNRKAALEFLIVNAVPAAIIKRVLYFPDQRRKYINDYLSGF